MKLFREEDPDHRCCSIRLVPIYSLSLAEEVMRPFSWGREYWGQGALPYFLLPASSSELACLFFYSFMHSFMHSFTHSLVECL